MPRKSVKQIASSSQSLKYSFRSLIWYCMVGKWSNNHQSNNFITRCAVIADAFVDVSITPSDVSATTSAFGLDRCDVRVAIVGKAFVTYVPHLPYYGTEKKQTQPRDPSTTKLQTHTVNVKRNWNNAMKYSRTLSRWSHSDVAVSKNARSEPNTNDYFPRPCFVSNWSVCRPE